MTSDGIVVYVARNEGVSSAAETSRVTWPTFARPSHWVCTVV